MRIRTHIVSWILLAAILPVTAVALGTIYFIEHSEQRRVKAEIVTSLNTISSDLKQHLQLQRNLAAGLAYSNVVQDFLPLLAGMEKQTIDHRFKIQWSRMNHYFEGFQTIVQGIYVMRILDRHGNTYVKVNNRRRSAPIYESVNGLFYVEQELNDPEFVALMEKLPANEVSSVILPHNQHQSELMNIMPVYDYLVPLYHQQKFVGAFALSLFGEDLDRVLDHAPRLYGANLFVIENNPDVAARHRMVLYEDQHTIQLSQIRERGTAAQELFGVDTVNAVIRKPYGQQHNPARHETIFFQEIFPYDNQFVSWVIGARIHDNYLTRPFEQARWIVLSVAVLALIINLVVANIGVHLLVDPIRAMAQKLLSFARGEHAERFKPDSRIDEVRDLSLAFNTMADSLAQAGEERDKAQHMMLQSAKLASIGQLAAGIGHELNNPLNNIISYAKLIDRQLPEDEQRSRQDLASLKAEAQRASAIVHGILNFARQVPPHFAEFAVLPWLQDTLALVRQSAKTAGITLAFECPDGIVMHGDKRQLQQALINLMLNAIAASERNGQVLVRIQSDDVIVRIEVIDQGKGIKPELLDKVFDPFFTTKSEGDGSGLGLSISLGIVERHAGQLQVINNLDKGVTAVMILPRVHNHE